MYPNNFVCPQVSPKRTTCMIVTRKHAIVTLKFIFKFRRSSSVFTKVIKQAKGQGDKRTKATNTFQLC